MGVTLMAILAACGPPEAVDPLQTPEGQLCADAYASAKALVAGMFERRRRPPPAHWPDRLEYVRRCLALELTQEQYACVDPAAARSAPRRCAELLSPAKTGVDQLTGWFNDALRASPSHHDPRTDSRGQESP